MFLTDQQAVVVIDRSHRNGDLGGNDRCFLLHGKMTRNLVNESGDEGFINTLPETNIVPEN